MFPTLLTHIEQHAIMWTFISPYFIISTLNRPLLLQCWTMKLKEGYEWKSFSRCPASPLLTVVHLISLHTLHISPSVVVEVIALCSVQTDQNTPRYSLRTQTSITVICTCTHVITVNVSRHFVYWNRWPAFGRGQSIIQREESNLLCLVLLHAGALFSCIVKNTVLTTVFKLSIIIPNQVWRFRWFKLERI